MAFYYQYLKLCNEKGISPSKAAIEAGVSKTSVSGWKTGRQNPTDANLLKLSAYFDVPVSYFFEDDNKKTDSNNGIGKIEIDDIVNAIESGKFTKDQLDDILFAVVAAKKN